jgi:predicted DCC family thiol-disulfide oxidoreductase YuxK
MQERLIVLYDAECVLCSKLVRFLIDRDPDGVIRFASLASGEVAGALMACTRCELSGGVPDSLVVIDGGRIYTHSSAALRIVRRLPRWRAAYMLVIFPKALRDAAYRFVARNRYRWFGRYDACPVPDARLRSRLLTESEAARYVELACISEQVWG